MMETSRCDGHSTSPHPHICRYSLTPDEEAASHAGREGRRFDSHVETVLVNVIMRYQDHERAELVPEILPMRRQGPPRHSSCGTYETEFPGFWIGFSLDNAPKIRMQLCRCRISSKTPRKVQKTVDANKRVRNGLLQRVDENCCTK